MNTNTFKPGDVCVVLHLEQPLYTFHLLGDEGWWYNGGHDLTTEPKKVFLLLADTITSVKKGLTDEEIIFSPKIPLQYRKSAEVFLKNLRRILDTPTIGSRKTADNMSVSVARFLLGLPRGKTLPSKEVVVGASLLRKVVATITFLETRSWPEYAGKIQRAEQYLLGISEPKDSAELLHPLSAHIIMAEVGEVCAMTTWNGDIRFGVLLGMRETYGYQNPLILTPPRVFQAKQSDPVVIIPTGSLERTRSVLQDPRTLTIRHDRFGEMVTLAVELQKRLSTLHPPSRLPGFVIDPETVLGIRVLREIGLNPPPLGGILRAKILEALYISETSPGKAHSAFIAAATAMRAAEQLLNN